MVFTIKIFVSDTNIPFKNKSDCNFDQFQKILVQFRFALKFEYSVVLSETLYSLIKSLEIDEKKAIVSIGGTPMVDISKTLLDYNIYEDSTLEIYIFK